MVLSAGVVSEPGEKSDDDNKTEEPSQGSTFNAEDHKDWGSYYDPKNEFCGKYDCYKILGFDYESFGKEHPSKKEITQRYRTLSRLWHPDKNKKRADAKERFVVRFPGAVLIVVKFVAFRVMISVNVVSHRYAENCSSLRSSHR